jgi:GAF domain-containing protein/HAMP domain-containing protein
MPPVSTASSGHPSGKITRKMFLIFFSIAMIPIVVIIAAAFSYASEIIRGLSLAEQQRLVVLLTVLTLLIAGLVAMAARYFFRPIDELVRVIAAFIAGNWDNRAEIRKKDEIGMLSQLFNQLADELSETRHLLQMRESDPEDGRQPAAIQLAHLAISSETLDELLRGALDLFIKYFACNYAAIYLIERREPAGVSFAVLSHKAGSLENEAPDLAIRLREERINLDTTPTMDWLVGRTIASRRPQVGATQDDSGVFEAALPIILRAPASEGRVVGVVDLFTTSRVKDSRLGPFSIRAVAEMQSLVGILGLGLANFIRTPGTTATPATGKLSSFLPDLETVFSTSRRMSQAESSEEILEAMVQALRTSPFSSAVLLRPDDVTVETNLSKVPMRVVECRSNRSQPLVSPASADTIVSPRLDTVERFFAERHGEMLLISDVNQAATNLDRKPQWQAMPAFTAGLEEPDPPRELVLIARWLGCRTAAFLPVLRNSRLLAILLLGSTPDMPPLTAKAELLEPYRDLLNLAATGLERIQIGQNMQRQLVELETFWQISQAISYGANFSSSGGEADIDSLYVLIHRQVERAMGQLSSFAIVLYDAESNLVHIPYMVEEEKRLQVAPFELGPGFSSEIIRTRQPLLMFTADEIDAKTQELNAKQVGEAPKSWLGVPMLFGGEVIGLIILQDVKQEFRFNAQDERLLSMLATQVAVVVRNAHLLETTRRQARQEHLVNEISDRIRRQVDVERILKTTTEELARALGVQKATIRIDPQVIGTGLATPESTILPGSNSAKPDESWEKPSSASEQSAQMTEEVAP